MRWYKYSCIENRHFIMNENNDKINQLLAKLEYLSSKQQSFSKEIYELREEIYTLRNVKTSRSNLDVKQETVVPSVSTQQELVYRQQPTNPVPNAVPKIKSDIEKFIGENLINKIGIAITIIGVAIGAKYSIEHQLISPLTRIILGYLMGLGLLGFGIKLKKKYENYSSVLVSGAIAILYFITYAAYDFYALIPQVTAFALMVVFTAFAVVAALNYNKQVIAIIGLVGGYAVPFLLSDGKGNVAVLFSYMAIINIGILLIALKKYWKLLYYSSFLLTWLIFTTWFFDKYRVLEHYALALIFLSVFFATFYSIFLAYKLIKKELFIKADIWLLLANSFVFFGVGCGILATEKTGAQLLGLFALCNAIVHFIISAIIYRQKLADRNLFYLIAGLVLVFITIAIPIQLDGNWVTLLWVSEAALLFWIGRTKNISAYEKLAYPIMFLAFFSIINDWQTNYNYNYYATSTAIRIMPLININFLTSVLFIASFGFINYLNNDEKYTPAVFKNKTMSSLINIFIPAIFLLVLYYAFRLEISNYCQQLFIDSALEIKKAAPDNINVNYWDDDFTKYKAIWIINYSMLFFSLLSFVNIKKIKNKYLGQVNVFLNTVVIIAFLTQGLLMFSELRENYISQTLSEYYHRGAFSIGVRYISFVFAGLLLTSLYKYISQDFLKPVSLKIKIAFDFLLFTSILWIASSELMTWMSIMKFSQSDKIGLSILWGVYALLLIALGIWKNKKHFRIGAIVLFAVTLIKLFIYDISYLDTIAKTIVFVSLGILLLIISFLYNKYKHLLTDQNEN